MYQKHFEKLGIKIDEKFSLFFVCIQNQIQETQINADPDP
jgi:hypothetical protein